VSDIQPELWVEHPSSEAIAFYQAAFGAVVAHRVGDSEDIAAQLAMGNASFWIANADAENGRFHPAALGGGTSRTLLVVDDPDTVVEAASGAGATVTSPVIWSGPTDTSRG
jgi:PhnB protein